MNSKIEKLHEQVEVSNAVEVANTWCRINQDDLENRACEDLVKRSTANWVGILETWRSDVGYNYGVESITDKDQLECEMTEFILRICTICAQQEYSPLSLMNYESPNDNIISSQLDKSPNDSIISSHLNESSNDGYQHLTAVKFHFIYEYHIEEYKNHIANIINKKIRIGTFNINDDQFNNIDLNISEQFNEEVLVKETEIG
ncbi:9317_t:CDS:2, partial [Diversispora eburnea]